MQKITLYTKLTIYCFTSIVSPFFRQAAGNTIQLLSSERIENFQELKDKKYFFYILKFKKRLLKKEDF